MDIFLRTSFSVIYTCTFYDQDGFLPFLFVVNFYCKNGDLEVTS